MVALGVSAIGDVQGAFVQNTKKLNEYYAALDEGRFPIERGYALDEDDQHPASCHHRADVQRPSGRRTTPSCGSAFAFDEYFAAELARAHRPGLAGR